ncbi:MAG: peptidylprolyl isomerase [Alistipes sp.]|nr:peptidylprolyl isomerase [Alistipes sp.]
MNSKFKIWGLRHLWVLALLLSSGMVSCQRPHSSSVELISDGCFERGFALSPLSPIEVQQAGGFERSAVDTLRFAESEQTPVWQLCQWWSRYDLAQAQCQNHSYTNQSKSVSLQDGVLRLESRSSQEYESHRTGSENWVHLLIQQQLNSSPQLSRVGALRLAMDVRLDYCHNAMGEAFDSKIHTAHAPFYLHLRNENPHSADYKKMLWVGFLSFDYRYEELQSTESVHWDVGTSTYIYTIPAKAVWGDVSFHDKKWHRAELDLVPHIRRAIEAMQERGEWLATRLEDLKIDEINFGWEMPGTFDAALEMRNLSLQAELRHQAERISLHTSQGLIELELSDLTPGHRDNMLRLVDEGYFDGLLFHRVIENFMIQGGDPFSKGVSSQSYDPMAGDKAIAEGKAEPQSIAAEIRFPELMHQRGVLAAAREGDDVNPQRRSSHSQFYIVWGRTFDDEQLDRYELRRIKATGDTTRYTPAQREVYKTIGGTPHLDGQYTVFGHVTEGLDVVEKIQRMATDSLDRPVADVRIVRAERVNREK